jgi:hypothetical protein
VAVEFEVGEVTSVDPAASTVAATNVATVLSISLSVVQAPKNNSSNIIDPVIFLVNMSSSYLLSD